MEETKEEPKIEKKEENTTALPRFEIKKWNAGNLCVVYFCSYTVLYCIHLIFLLYQQVYSISLQ